MTKQDFIDTMGFVNENLECPFHKKYNRDGKRLYPGICDAIVWQTDDTVILDLFIETFMPFRLKNTSYWIGKPIKKNIGYRRFVLENFVEFCLLEKLYKRL